MEFCQTLRDGVEYSIAHWFYYTIIGYGKDAIANSGHILCLHVMKTYLDVLPNSDFIKVANYGVEGNSCLRLFKFNTLTGLNAKIKKHQATLQPGLTMPIKTLERVGRLDSIDKKDGIPGTSTNGDQR